MASIKKDPKTNKYYFVVDIGKKPNGKRDQVKRRGFATKKQAEQALAEVLTAVKKGEHVDHTSIIFEAFILQWLEDKKKSIVVDTYANYSSIIQNQIIPRLGSVPLQKLTALTVQKVINDMHKEGLSAATIKRVFNILRSAMKKAVTWKLIPHNVTQDDIELPRDKDKELQVWDVDEVRRFLLATRNSKYYIIYLLAITTGMRQGEILGLRWKDVDFKEKKLYIRQVLSHNGKDFKQSAKSKAGNRSISISEEVVELLKEHKKQKDYYKKFYDKEYAHLDLVNCIATGKQIHPTNLYETFKSTIRKHGLPDITFHDLRHTHASLMLKLNVHPKVVQERLGHANMAVTMNIYSHLFPSMQREAAEDFGRMIFEEV